MVINGIRYNYNDRKGTPLEKANYLVSIDKLFYNTFKQVLFLIEMDYLFNDERSYRFQVFTNHTYCNLIFQTSIRFNDDEFWTMKWKANGQEKFTLREELSQYYDDKLILPFLIKFKLLLEG